MGEPDLLVVRRKRDLVAFGDTPTLRCTVLLATLTSRTTLPVPSRM